MEGQEELYDSDPQKYKIDSILGKGTSATVYKAYYEGKETPIALKIINLETTTQSLEQVQREIKTLSNSHYRTITPLYKAFVSNTYLIIAMKEMKLSVNDFLQQLHPTGLKQEYIATIMKDVLEALVYLHQNNQIHRDIKLSNLLLDDQGTTYLSDFGVTGFIDPYSSKKKNTFCGTLLTIAPEVANSEPYDQKADIWSFCLCCYQLATGNLPYETLNSMEALFHIRTGQKPDFSKNSKIKKELREILNIGLQRNPQDRPTAQQLLNMDFFKVKSVKNDIKNEVIQYLLMKTQSSNLQNQEEIENMNQMLQGRDSVNNGTTSGWDFSYEQTEKEKAQSSIVLEQHIDLRLPEEVDIDKYQNLTQELIQEVKHLRQENKQLKERIQQLMEGK